MIWIALIDLLDIVVSWFSSERRAERRAKRDAEA